MQIPIQNLYYLFCYAWSHFNGGKLSDVGTERCPDIANLFAKLLIEGLSQLARRGLDRDYQLTCAQTQSLRGRIDLDELVKRQTLKSGYLSCWVDELSVDTLHNRILKASALTLARVYEVMPAQKSELIRLAKGMQSVSDVRVNATHFRMIQFSAKTRHYRFLMKICEFVFRCLLPTQAGTGSRFSNILEDETAMSAVFEEFLRNFYRIHGTTFKVKRDVLEWDARSDAAESLALLPSLETDFVLHSKQRAIVFEAKYYRQALEGKPGLQKRIRSQHLRQLFAYLHHVGRTYPEKEIDGVLIYPTGNTALDHSYQIAERSVRVITLDLKQQWQIIHNELMAIVGRHEGTEVGVHHI